MSYYLRQVSSEEESPIFHRSLKTPTFDDGDEPTNFWGLEKGPSELNLVQTGLETNDAFAAPYGDISYDTETSLDEELPSSASDMATALSRMEHELGVKSNTISSVSNTDHSGNNSDMILALSRMERELGVSLSVETSQPQTMTSTDAQRSNNDIVAMDTNNTDNDSGTSATDHNSIELSFSTAGSICASPRSVKRLEIPELSPHRSSTDDKQDQCEIVLHICSIFTLHTSIVFLQILYIKCTC